MINFKIEDINKKHIEALIKDKIEESRTLEYKEKLSNNTDNEKKEFLADVSSFANTSGGDIVYGIKEERDEEGKKTGRAEEAVGIAGITEDEIKLKIENIIRDGLSPRLKVQIKCIDGFPKGLVIILRIPQSFSAPHMILKGSSKFYSRNSAGKYHLDVGEIRSAFLASEALPEKIKRFREQRLAEIIAYQAPVELISNSLLVIHLIPVSSFLYGTNTENIIVSSENDRFKINTSTSASYYRYNIDGYLSAQKGDANKYISYSQIYRTGIIEYVDCNFINPVFLDGKIHCYIDSKNFETQITENISNFINLMEDFKIETPILIMISLLNVKGVEMAIEYKTNFLENIYGHKSIDRDSIILPDILLDDFSVKIVNILKPAFDSIWQACGHRCSPNYKKQSN